MLVRIVFVWLAVLVGLWFASKVIPGVRFESGRAFWFGGIMLGLLDATLGPVLLVATFPLTVITLGLFAFVVNAALVLLASALVPGFDVDGLFPAFNAGLILAGFAVVGFLVADLYLFGGLQWELLGRGS